MSIIQETVVVPDGTTDSCLHFSNSFRSGYEMPVAISERGSCTVSFWIKSSSDTGKMSVNIFGSTKVVEANKTWKRVSVSGEIGIGSIIYAALDNSDYYIYKSQLERGDFATDWIVASEDTDALITELSVEAGRIRALVVEIQDNYATKSELDIGIGNISAKVENIGGRNLLRNTETFIGNNWTKQNSAYITIDGDSEIISANGQTSNVYSGMIGRICSFAEANKKQFTLSFEAYSDDWDDIAVGTTTGLSAIQFVWVTDVGSYANYNYKGKTLNTSDFVKTPTTPVDGEWCRFVCKPFTVNESFFDTVEESGIGEDFGIGVLLRRNGTLKVRHFKVEEGLVATGWTTAQEEIKSSGIEIYDDHLEISSSGIVRIKSADFDVDILQPSGESAKALDVQDDGSIRFKAIYASNVRDNMQGTVKISSSEMTLDGLSDYVLEHDVRSVEYTVVGNIDTTPVAVFRDSSFTLEIYGNGYNIPSIRTDQSYSGSIYINNAIIRQSNSSSYAVFANSGSIMLYDCWFMPGTTKAVCARYNSAVRWICTSQPPEKLTCTTAFYANCGGFIYYGGYYPGGDMTKNYAGKIEVAEDYTNTQWSGSGGDIPTIKSASFAPTTTGTYYGSSYMSTDNDVRQGYTKSNGRTRGVMLFGSLGISGTLGSMSITIRRMIGYGVGGAVTIEAYGTTVSTKATEPTIVSASFVNLGAINPGETKTFAIPAGSDLALGLFNGTYKGIVLYSSDTTVFNDKTYSRNYARFEASSVQLDVVYEE